MKKRKPLVEQLPDLAKKLKHVAGKVSYAEMVYGHTLFDTSPLVRLVEAGKLIEHAGVLILESYKELSLAREKGEGK